MSDKESSEYIPSYEETKLDSAERRIDRLEQRVSELTDLVVELARLDPYELSALADTRQCWYCTQTEGLPHFEDCPILKASEIVKQVDATQAD